MPTARSFAPLGTLPAVTLLAAGLPLLLFGVFQAIQVGDNNAQFQTASGTVTVNQVRTSLDPEGSRTRRRSYHPVVKFTTQDGQTLEFTDAIGAKLPLYAVGDTVGVLYDPRDPSRAYVTSWRAWQGPVTYIALGFFLVLIVALWGTWTFFTVPRKVL